MPYTVVGEPSSWRDTEYKKDYNYKYPKGLDLRPDSKLHQRLRSRIWERARASRNEISKRFSSWREIDKNLTTYIPLKEKEEELKAKDPNKPVSIVFPYSYSMLEALLTYLSMAFFQDPMFQYEGVEDDDTVGAMLMEMVIRLHCIKNKVPLAVHTVLRDSLGYGVGIGIPDWRRQYGKKVIKATVTTQSELGTETQNHNTFVDSLLFEGNALGNIDPYMWLPDPSVSSVDIQKGEFIGWVDRDNYMNLLSQENQSDSGMFNVKYLKNKKNKKSSLALDESDRNTRHGGATDMARTLSGTVSPVDIIHMYITLIPREWKLSTSERPEKWYFELAGDDVIIACEKADHNHGQYPMAVASPEYDGYSITPIGRMEVLYGLQHTLDFLFNCYDDKTEVLTKRGWVPFPDTNKDDEIATVNSDTREFWFESPKQWFEYDYDGKMHTFNSSRMDICVTPNHNMLVADRYRDNWELLPALVVAKTSSKKYRTLGNLRWKGTEPPPFILAEDRTSNQNLKEVTIGPLTFMKFLGWFLSEGSISNTGRQYATVIGQKKEENIAELEELMEHMPFKVCRVMSDSGYIRWQISDKRFHKWLRDNCYSQGGYTSEYKKLPNCLREWSEEYLNIFFISCLKGDGSERYSDYFQYGSTSKALVDGLQEVALRLGYFSFVSDAGETKIGNKMYTLNIKTSETAPYIQPKNCSTVDYNGKVYSFENSTHITITRRNGKIAICGQSHVANVRKAINDMLVVDPYLVNINDLKDPQPGKLIRLRRPAWGRGVDKVVQQLQVNDITRANIADSAYITGWMDRISGADQSMQGALRQSGPERLTGAEFSGTRNSAMSRLQRMAMIIGMQFMQDVGTQFAVHTQQYMTQDAYIAIIGRYSEQLQKNFGPGKTRGRVSPSDLAVNYDMIVRDGSIPGGNFSQSWIELFKVIGTSPELTQQFDVARIFTYIAQQLGAKNVEDFRRNLNRIQAVSMPDEQVADQVQRGNMIPSGA
jgi:hypothetical protein